MLIDDRNRDFSQRFSVHFTDKDYLFPKSSRFTSFRDNFQFDFRIFVEIGSVELLFTVNQRAILSLFLEDKTKRLVIPGNKIIN